MATPSKGRAPRCVTLSRPWIATTSSASSSPRTPDPFAARSVWAPASNARPRRPASDWPFTASAARAVGEITGARMLSLAAIALLNLLLGAEIPASEVVWERDWKHAFERAGRAEDDFRGLLGGLVQALPRN